MTVVNPVTTVGGEAAPTRRLRADAARNQQRIIEAARELFATRGLDITLDDVADHAGVGVGTVYRRFANKQELIDGIFEQHVETMAEHAESALADPDPWSGLSHFFEFACRNMAVNRGLGEILMSLDDGRERVASMKERMQPAITRIVERARESGALRPDAEQNDFFALIHMVDAIADLARGVHPEAWRRYLSIVLDGLRADCQPRAPLPTRSLTDSEIHAAKEACAGRRH